jgi:hypothetical protein
MKDNGKDIGLMALSENKTAIRLHKKFGFRVFSHRCAESFIDIKFINVAVNALRLKAD